MVPQNAQQSNEQVQPIVTQPAAQDIVQQPAPEDECVDDYDCGFGKRCDYPLCKACVEGQPCHCPKICMVVTSQGELREAKR